LSEPQAVSWQTSLSGKTVFKNAIARTLPLSTMTGFFLRKTTLRVNFAESIVRKNTLQGDSSGRWFCYAQEK